MWVWILILTMAAVTYANRVVFLLKAVRAVPSPQVNVFLSYSSYAVLTAIWSPIVFNFSYQTGVVVNGLDYVSAASVAALLTILRVPSIVVVLVSIGAFAVIRFWF